MHLLPVDLAARAEARRQPGPAELAVVQGLVVQGLVVQVLSRLVRAGWFAPLALAQERSRTASKQRAGRSVSKCHLLGEQSGRRDNLPFLTVRARRCNAAGRAGRTFHCNFVVNAFAALGVAG